MRTTQMTIDDDFVENVEKIAKELNTTRSAFTRDVLRETVKHYNIRRLELEHRQGYALHPFNKEEFDRK